MVFGPADYLAGRLLVAMPGIEDPRFERAVIYICAHDAGHAMGLTLNRPVEGLTVGRLLAKLGVKTLSRPLDDLVLMGGPVEPERGFVLHTDDYPGDGGSVVIGGGVALTATREVLEALAASGSHPRKSVMALGYAGWDGGQLDREIRHNVWLTCEPDEGLLFGDDHDHKWSRALAKIGVAAERLSAQSGRA
jgi:putative transcriptional regulator